MAAALRAAGINTKHTLTAKEKSSRPRLSNLSTTMEDIKGILALIVLIAVLIAGIWMDNHLPGFNPVETRMHP